MTAPGMLTNPIGHVSVAQSQGLHMLPVMPQPAVISMGSLAPMPAVATAAPGFPPFHSQTVTANSSLSNIPLSVANSQRTLQKQISGERSQLQGMVGALQLGMAANALPGHPSSNLIFPPNPAMSAVAPAVPAANHMGSIASLVSAGLLPHSHAAAPQALPVSSLRHFSALLDMPISSGVGSTMHATPVLFHLP